MRQFAGSSVSPWIALVGTEMMSLNNSHRIQRGAGSGDSHHRGWLNYDGVVGVKVMMSMTRLWACWVWKVWARVSHSLCPLPSQSLWDTEEGSFCADASPPLPVLNQQSSGLEHISETQSLHLDTYTQLFVYREQSSWAGTRVCWFLCSPSFRKDPAEALFV